MADEMNEINEAGGDNNQGISELEALTARMNEVVADLLQQESYLKGELVTKKEYLASFTLSLENSDKEMPEFQRQIAEMREVSEKYQSLIMALSSLAAGQEMQLKDLKKVIVNKEKVITSFAINLDNNKTEQKSDEENTGLQEEQKDQKKKLKRLQKAEQKSSKDHE
jgi:chromosome segregation ATPase